MEICKLFDIFVHEFAMEIWSDSVIDKSIILQ